MKTLTKTKVFQAVLAIIVGVFVGLSLADLFSSYMEGGWRIATDITFAISGAMLSYVLVGPREFLAEFRAQKLAWKKKKDRKLKNKKDRQLDQKESLSRYPGLTDLAKKLYILRSVNRVMCYFWVLFSLLFFLFGIPMMYSLGEDVVSVILFCSILSCLISIWANDGRDTMGILSEESRNSRVLSYLGSLSMGICDPHQKSNPYEKYEYQIFEEIRSLPKFFFGPLTLLWMLLVFLWQCWPIIIAKTLYCVQSAIRYTVSVSTLVGFATGWTYDYNRIVGCLAGTSVGLMVIAISKLGLRFLPDPNLSIDDYKEFALVESKR